MTLRARLTLFFAGIVVVPLVAATVVIQTLVSREIERRADTRLRLGANAAAALWGERLIRAESELRGVAAPARKAMAAGDLPGRIRGIRAATDLDFLVITGPSGDLLAAETGPASFLDIRAPGPRQLAAEESPVGVLRARVRVPLAGGEATLTGGWWSDARAVEDLASVTGLEVAIVEGRHVLASTIVPPPRVPEEPGPVAIEEGWAVVSRVAGESGGVMLVAPPERGFGGAIWLVTLAGLFGVVTLGYLLARMISRPLQRLTEGATAVASGRLDTRVDVAEGDDVARVAEAFNQMTASLRQHVGELERSRDEARRNLDRLGATLRSTHDLEAMLGVILDSAAAMLRARAGALYLLTPGRELRLEVANGYEPPSEVAIRPGEGIAGLAADGEPVLVRPDVHPAPAPAPGEPDLPTALAVPLVRGDRTMGVVALYGRDAREPFGDQDVDTLASFAGQASVAIENVLLHQEAQRLSITDGLTGVWNRRYLEFTLAKEIERAQRFGRPLSVIMVDIDHFKDVNDDHGHQRGDEVLIEVARRMMGGIRSQIDTLARYGGEEFVIVLPETPPDGARVVADKVLEAVREEAFTTDDGPDIQVTVSAGCASFPHDGATVEDLVAAADQALYRAKEEGRDRVAVSRA